MKNLEQIEKIQAMVYYIVQQLGEVDYIHLFKIMYFSQQEHLVQYGKPIVDDSFVALKHGPVPSLTYKVLRLVEGKDESHNDDLNDFIAGLQIRTSSGHQMVSLKTSASVDMDELSGSNLKVLDKWIEDCKNVQSFDLSVYSHDKAWQKAKKESEKTGERVKLPLVDIAAAGGAGKEMLEVIRDRQLLKHELQWT